MTDKKKYNYCFICVTSYQYILSDLTAKRRYEKNGETSLVILKYVNGVKTIDNEYADYIKIDRNFVGRAYSVLIGKTCFSRIITGMLEKNASVAYFNDRDPISYRLSMMARKNGGKVVLMEEGLGTYFHAEGTDVIGNRAVPDIAYVGFPSLYKETHANHSDVKQLDYAKIFRRENIGPYVQQFQVDFKGDILFLGQATISDESPRILETDFLKNILEKFPGKRIMIKPHPRDNNPWKYAQAFRKYGDGIMLLPDEIARYPVESLIYSLDVKLVASLSSSGGVTLANMFPYLKVAFIFVLVGLDIGGMAKQMLRLKDYNQNLYFPKNYDEMEELMDGKCGERIKRESKIHKA